MQTNGPEWIIAFTSDHCAYIKKHREAFRKESSSLRQHHCNSLIYVGAALRKVPKECMHNWDLSVSRLEHPKPTNNSHSKSAEKARQTSLEYLLTSWSTILLSRGNETCTHDFSIDHPQVLNWYYVVVNGAAISHNIAEWVRQTPEMSACITIAANVYVIAVDI